MAKTFFIAARNSRHRIAALALYRALIRTSRQISLPKDVSQSQNGDHPVSSIVRKRFEGNRTYTSLRLVYSSMTAGYKFLTMLKKAQMPESTEHTDVVEFLRKRKEKGDITRAQKAAQASQRPPRKPEKSRAEHTPLLTNVANPAESPRYIANPRTNSSSVRRKRVPQFAWESHGYPFLRYSKPQPERLNQMVRRNAWLWEKKIDGILEIDEQWAPDAMLEDQWEEELRQVALKEGIAKQVDAGKKEVPDEETFLWSAMTSKLWFEWRLENMWEHWTARGDALSKLVNDERALFEKETKERREANVDSVAEAGSEDKAQSGDDLADLVNKMANLGNSSSQEVPTETLLPPKEKPVSAKEPLPGSGTPDPKVLVPKHSRMVALDAAKKIMKDLDRRGISWEEKEGDPFASPVWMGLAEGQSSRIARWANIARGLTTPSARGKKGEEADVEDDFSSMIKAQVREV